MVEIADMRAQHGVISNEAGLKCLGRFDDRQGTGDGDAESILGTTVDETTVHGLSLCPPGTEMAGFIGGLKTKQERIKLCLNRALVINTSILGAWRPGTWVKPCRGGGGAPG